MRRKIERTAVVKRLCRFLLGNFIAVENIIDSCFEEFVVYLVCFCQIIRIVDEILAVFFSVAELCIGKSAYIISFIYGYGFYSVSVNIDEKRAINSFFQICKVFVLWLWRFFAAEYSFCDRIIFACLLRHKEIDENIENTVSNSRVSHYLLRKWVLGIDSIYLFVVVAVNEIGKLLTLILRNIRSAVNADIVYGGSVCIFVIFICSCVFLS